MTKCSRTSLEQQGRCENIQLIIPFDFQQADRRSAKSDPATHLTVIPLSNSSWRASHPLTPLVGPRYGKETTARVWLISSCGLWNLCLVTSTALSPPTTPPSEGPVLTRVAHHGAHKAWLGGATLCTPMHLHSHRECLPENIGIPALFWSHWSRLSTSDYIGGDDIIVENSCRLKAASWDNDWMFIVVDLNVGNDSCTTHFVLALFRRQDFAHSPGLSDTVLYDDARLTRGHKHLLENKVIRIKIWILYTRICAVSQLLVKPQQSSTEGKPSPLAGPAMTYTCSLRNHIRISSSCARWKPIQGSLPLLMTRHICSALLHTWSIF